MRMIPAVIAIVIFVASPLLAKPPLSQVTAINNGLLTVGIADVIRKECGSISGRLLKGVTYLSALKRKAVAMGYTEAEIDAYVASKPDKARLKAQGMAYLIQRGVIEGQPETYCTVGHAEIAEGSGIGSFLRAN